MTSTTSRRAVVRGAAWAVPAVAISAAAPAFAASTSCATDAYFDSQIQIYGNYSADWERYWYDFGDVATNTTGTLTIPEGVTVVSFSQTLWVQTNSGTEYVTPGLPSPANSRLQYYAPNATNSGPTLKRITGPMSGKFWSFRENIAVDSGAAVGPAYDFTYEGEATKTWPSGYTATAWGLTSHWRAGQDSRQATYSSNGNSCQTVILPWLGAMQFVGQNVEVPTGQRNIPVFREWEVVLSNGEVLTGTYVNYWADDPNWDGEPY